MTTTLKTGRVVLCTAFILFALFAIASAKISRGTLKTKDNFVLLSRFTVSTAGKGMVLFESSDMKPGQDAKDNKMFLSFYNDEKKEDWYWKNVDNDKQSEKACIDKLNDQHYENVEAHVNGSSWEFPITNSHTPHSWWIAVSDCAKSSNEDFGMWYDVHWVNAGSSWYREFSLEDQDLLTIYVIFFIFWFLILPGFFYAFIKKIAIQKQKPSLEFKLLLVGMIFTFFALLFYLIHYSVYASDGRGVQWLLGIAESLDMIQTVVLMSLIYLFLRGKRERTFVDLGVVGFLLLMYFSFFWWQLPDSILESIDEKYKWQTAPGITMLCFRFLLFCYLAFLIALKIKNESNLYRRIVLVVLFLAATFYFLTLPFTVILMTGASFFYRWKTVLAVSLSIDMITYLFFGLILVESPLAKLLNPISIRPYDPLIKDGDDDSNNPYGSL